MIYWFSCWFAVTAMQRLLELRLAQRNAELLRKEGGYEVGADHYRTIVLLHFCFFSALLLEFGLRRPPLALWMLGPLAIFLLLQVVRAWCIHSLGKYWNTRIIVIPGMTLVRKGPYRFLKHPNYVVVTLELLFFPLMFGCFATALLFPLLNVLVLRKRIAVEEQALRTCSAAAGTIQP